MPETALNGLDALVHAINAAGAVAVLDAIGDIGKDAEIRQLKRELAPLTEERDI